MKTEKLFFTILMVYVLDDRIPARTTYLRKVQEIIPVTGKNGRRSAAKQ